MVIVAGASTSGNRRQPSSCLFLPRPKIIDQHRRTQRRKMQGMGFPKAWILPTFTIGVQALFYITAALVL
jgi:hypothetical protein